MDLLNLINRASTKDLYTVLSYINEKVCALAERLSIGSWILFLLGMAVAAVIGFYGYKLIKLVMAAGLGFVGYIVGNALAELLGESFTWLPTWSGYLFGAIIAVLFLFLAYIKFSYVLFAASGIAGYIITLFYFENSALALGGAVLLAILSVTFIRTVFILASGFSCGMLFVGCLSQLLPKVEFLQLREGEWVSLILALGLAAVFAVVQFVNNRHCGETVEC
jgi:hypothetical protein